MYSRTTDQVKVYSLSRSWLGDKLLRIQVNHVLIAKRFQLSHNCVIQTAKGHKNYFDVQ